MDLELELELDLDLELDLERSAGVTERILFIVVLFNIQLPLCQRPAAALVLFLALGVFLETHSGAGSVESAEFLTLSLSLTDKGALSVSI